MNYRMLDLVADDLGNERLDGIILQSKEYKDAKERVDEAYARLLGAGLSDEVNELLEAYIEEFNAAAAIFDRLTYQQGMKDLMELFTDLLA